MWTTVGQPLKLCLGSLCIIGIDIAVSVTALLQCGSCPRAAGRVVTSSGACDTWASLLDTLINAHKYRYNPICNLIQTHLGFGQYRSLRDAIKSGNVGKQRFGMPVGHISLSCLKEREPKDRFPEGFRHLDVSWPQAAHAVFLNPSISAPRWDSHGELPGRLQSTQEWGMHGKCGRSSHRVRVLQQFGV